MESDKPQRLERLLNKAKVSDVTGMKNTRLHEIQNPNSPYYDPDFPKPRRRAPGFPPFWLESEIEAWIKNFGTSPAKVKPGRRGTAGGEGISKQAA